MTKHQGPGLLLAIAVFKLAKSGALIALGVCALLLVRDGDAYTTLRSLVSQLRLDPDNRYVHKAIGKLSGIDSTKLEALSLGTFVYAAVFLIEGVGLALRKRWAEYLTTIVTASFIPFEVYEMAHKPSLVKAAGIALNLAIVAYLTLRLRSEHRGG